MSGPAPKPDDQRVRRNKPTFSWSLLPAGGRQGRAPELPKRAQRTGSWSSATKEAWVRMWATPQATQWDPSGITLHQWAELFEEKTRLQQANRDVPKGIFDQIEKIEHKHGLNPQAMLQLRWRIAEEGEGDEIERPPSGRRRSTERKKRALHVIHGGE